MLASIFACLFLFCFCFVFVNLTQARVIWEEGLLTEKTLPLNWPRGKPGGDFLD